MCVIFSNYLIEMHFWRARWLGQLLWNDRSKHICNYINYYYTLDDVQLNIVVP